MTLPKRLVSLLLTYCFLIAAAPITRAEITQFNSGSNRHANSPAELSSITKALDLVSSWFAAKELKPSDDEDANKEEGLRFRLSEAPEQPEARPVSKIANAAVLSDAETQAILNRLPQIKSEPNDEAQFALREKSLPPPRTGAIAMQPFPAPNEMAAPGQPTAGPLEVLRYLPEGDVPIAPNLSITFSQPMVAVTSQEEAAENVPVKLAPQPPGKWHWIGTKTLLFEPDGRFPMATQYSITVPAGTKSANGGTLAQSKSWTFTTPAPTVTNFYPARATVQRRDVLMFAEFDQRIDPSAMRKHTQLMAESQRFNVRLATPEEIHQNEDVRDLVKGAQKDRWLAFRAIDANGKFENALPAGANVNVSILSGAPSAEGPRSTQQTQVFP